MSTTNCTPTLLSVRETAERLGISSSQMYQLARNGKSPVEPVRVGHLIRFRSVEVDAFVLGEAA